MIAGRLALVTSFAAVLVVACVAEDGAVFRHGGGPDVDGSAGGTSPEDAEASESSSGGGRGRRVGSPDAATDSAGTRGGGGRHSNAGGTRSRGGAMADSGTAIDGRAMPDGGIVLDASDDGSAGAGGTSSGGGAAGSGGVTGGSGGSAGAAGGHPSTGGSAGAPSCPGYATGNACARCTCSSCATQVAACFMSTDGTKNALCAAIQACAQTNHCASTSCYCAANDLLCTVPSGPCVSQIDQAAGGSPSALTIQTLSQDTSHPIGRATAVGSCALANCRVECGL